jgi:lipid-A-disaccharide synthase
LDTPQRVLDLGDLDTEAPYLHLRVCPTKMLQTAVRIQASVPGTRFAIAAFSPRQAVTCRRQLEEFPQLAMEVHTGRTAELIQAATACLACSGSVSLDLLYHQKPSVIHYRISKTAYHIQRFFRKVRFITLANLLASEDRYCTRGEVYDPRRDRVPFPEYLTYGDRSGDMAQHLVAWLTDGLAHEQAVRRIRSLHQQFAHAGASQRAAEYLSERLTVSEPPLRTHHVPGKAAA